MLTWAVLAKDASHDSDGDKYWLRIVLCIASIESGIVVVDSAANILVVPLVAFAISTPDVSNASTASHCATDCDNDRRDARLVWQLQPAAFGANIIKSYAKQSWVCITVGCNLYDSGSVTWDIIDFGPRQLAQFLKPYI